jgi:predicted ATP-dependent protease
MAAPIDPREYLVDAAAIDFSIPKELLDAKAAPSFGVIGQPRAVEALKLGTAIRSKGYHIFVTGPAGTGRRTAIIKVIGELTEPAAPLRDIALVYDFSKPLSPKVLYFPSGIAARFKEAIHGFVERVKQILALQVEGEAYKERAGALNRATDEEEGKQLSAFEAELAKDGFKIVQEGIGGSVGADLRLMIGDEAFSIEELQALVDSGKLDADEWGRLRERYYARIDEMKALFSSLRQARSKLDAQLSALKEDLVLPLIAAELGALAESFPQEAARAWLAELESDIASHLYLFEKARLARERKRRREGPATLFRYGVNVLVEAGQSGKAPLVFENHPTYANLFGSIDARGDSSDLRDSYLHIRPGSLLQASGGYLVLRAEDIVGDEECWPLLKRVLRSGMLEVQPQVPGGQGSPPLPVKPEPIEVDAKVIIIGSESVYDLLYQSDPDFQKLFKVCAEFDSTMGLNAEGIAQYLGFIKMIAREEKLLPATADGMTAIIEHGVRLSEYRNRLSTRFALVADLIREADYAARKASKAEIDAKSVEEALRRREFMHNLPQDKIASMIASGEILLQAEGLAVGRINGLAVHDRGYYAFGMPTVISAQAAPGEVGVVNIESEAGLSGEIYDKGLLIVEGFLRSRYARDFPLSMTASICFEQSYVPVDGDSASAAITCALLSSLSGIPLRQDIGVTGSMNQMGTIQPVGGVSEKVEGFYRVCERIGLSGRQGVAIPARNVESLVLSRPVREAIKAGRFHVWAVRHIDDLLSLLTGAEAGRAAAGVFPQDSLNGKVQCELKRFFEMRRALQA